MRVQAKKKRKKSEGECFQSKSNQENRAETRASMEGMGKSNIQQRSKNREICGKQIGTFIGVINAMTQSKKTKGPDFCASDKRAEVGRTQISMFRLIILII